MNCLWDYIGIKGCGTQTPQSGMFINQLPGLTLERIDKIAEKEQINFVGVWNDVRTRAWIRLEKDLRLQLRTKYKLSSIKSYEVAKPVIDTNTLIDAAEKYRGVVIDLGIRPGTFLTISIDSISITLTANVETLPIKFFDADGNLLDTITFSNAVAGKNIISVNRKYFTTRLFIAIDATQINLYSASFPAEVLSSCYDVICNACGESCDPSIYGAEADLTAPGNLTNSGVLGFDVNYSIVCDYSSIVCSNKTEFTDVWMFCLGVELMLENIYSTRLTRFTTVDKESSVELKDYYTAEYEDALEEAVKVLSVQEEDCCIVCDQAVGYRERLP